MSKRIRTFIAIDTPPDFKVQAEQIQKELDIPQAPVRWEKSYKLHLTLKFLGETETSLMPAIESRLQEVASAHRPFWLRYNGLGCFPNRNNPRILWVGCTPLSSELEHLQRHIEDACEKLGFERDKRTFHPHITIGRVKLKADKDRQLLTGLIKKMESITFDSLESEVHTILLMKSELRPGGSEYSILKSLALSS